MGAIPLSLAPHALQARVQPTAQLSLASVWHRAENSQQDAVGRTSTALCSWCPDKMGRRAEKGG